MNKQKDKQFVSDLKPGQGVSSPFLAKDKQLIGFANRQGQFLQATLADKTGEIKAVMWESAESAFSAFEDGDIVWVEGQIKTYKGSPQVTIHDIRSCEAGSYNLEDFLPRTSKDTEFLLQKLRDEAASVKDPFLWMLLESFLDDPGFVNAFLAAPAAKSIHHAYLGGLIEHTANVVDIVVHMAQIYPALDRDLLVAGAILHDVGKVVEYRFDGLLDVTDEGRLLGHIVIGDRMVSEKIKMIEDFPKELEMKLRHMVISHHGAYEYGSPRRPKFAEACVLHYADNMDAHTARFIQIQEANKNRSAHWSPYDSVFERYVYLGRRGEESRDEIAAAGMEIPCEGAASQGIGKDRAGGDE
ncbi:MAG TPA: HD domain-containing protein [Firmicutes bacterium]|nr:HD domain-containing protein [Bacillota bacterium]